MKIKFFSPPSRWYPTVVPLLALAAASLQGQQTHILGDSGYDDFAAGERERLSLGGRGKLETAPGMEKLAELDSGPLWAAVPDGEGGLWLSAGGEVSLLHMNGEGDVEKVFTSGAVLGSGLAVDTEGTVYLGTSPDGRVYRLRKGAAKPEAFARLPVDYIWEVAWAGGNLWAATGLPARLYRINPESGEAEAVFTAQEDHLQTYLHADGAHYLGGTPSGSVYRVEADGSAESLLSLPENEVRGLAMNAEGALWMLGYEAEASRRQAGDENPEEAFQRMMREAQGKETDSGQGKKGASVQSRLYRQNKDGFVLPVWGVPDGGGMSLHIFGEGVKLVGAESEGALYAVSGRDRWSRVVDLPGGGEVSQVIADPASEGTVFLLTSQPAVVYRLGGPAKDEGVFTSRIHDATQPVRWGTLELLVEGAPGLEVEIRSGNSPLPDATWRDWHSLDGGLDGGFFRADIATTATRYLQYRLTLTGNGPEDALRRSRLFVQLPNAVPLVSRVRSLPFAVEARRSPSNGRGFSYEAVFRKQKSADLSGNGKERIQFLRQPGSGNRSFFWRAQDPNGDPLVFDLYLHDRREDRRLLLERDLEDPFWNLSTDGFEEGVYQLEVVARDHWTENGSASTGNAFSETFLIDHSAPEIQAVKQETGEDDRRYLHFAVRDNFSVIQAVEVGFAGGPLRAVVPVDGLYDRREENFRVLLPERPTEGDFGLRIRAVDETGNEALRVP